MSVRSCRKTADRCTAARGQRQFGFLTNYAPTMREAKLGLVDRTITIWVHKFTHEMVWQRATEPHNRPYSRHTGRPTLQKDDDRCERREFLWVSIFLCKRSDGRRPADARTRFYTKYAAQSMRRCVCAVRKRLATQFSAILCENLPYLLGTTATLSGSSSDGHNCTSRCADSTVYNRFFDDEQPTHGVES